MRWLIYAMVYLGSALMVFNIIGFLRFARFIRGLKFWRWGNRMLYIPIVLLVSFLMGYLAVGIFGKPDLLVAGILFGGSIFVFVMYKLFSSILHRVVEIEHLEAELLAAEEANRAKSSFLASISHEMRTPMNVILGMDTLALKNRDLPDATREQLEKIGDNARYLSRLINGILDMQQMESGEMALRSEAFSLKEALEQIEAIVSESCAKKGLTFETAFAQCATREYTGDAAYLKQAVLSLLDNAVKFTDAPGTVKLSVACSKAQGKCSEIRFIVSDTGIGIDEDFLPRILEPFAREDASYTSRFGGSGMGLAVANSIVTQMGGRIEAASRKGEGSTFTIILPMTPTGPGEKTCIGNCECCSGCGGCERGAQEPDAAPVALAGHRVLVVDDMPDNAEIVSDLLELEGVECETAVNGQAAIDLVAGSAPGHFDAILMDLRMPVMDGMEAARRIRALDRADARRVPIIALTANDSETDIQETLKAGMNAHLVKPVDADRLYAALGKWITNGMGKEA